MYGKVYRGEYIVLADTIRICKKCESSFGACREQMYCSNHCAESAYEHNRYFRLKKKVTTPSR
jgi:hypothetical protein